MDAPQDLTASNIQTENAMLTWKPPRADITGYMLSFESADRTIRVSTQLILLSEGQCRSNCMLSKWNLFRNVCFILQEVVLSPTAVSYNMAQLKASTEYTVSLQALAGPKRSRVITTVFTTSE